MRRLDGIVRGAVLGCYHHALRLTGEAGLDGIIPAASGPAPVFAIDWDNGTTARDGTTPTTATRASTAYRTDWDGSRHLLTLVGPNAIRVGSFNDGSVTRRCVQLEGSSGNLCQRSEDFANSYWTKLGGTFGAGAAARDLSKSMGRFTTGVIAGGQSYFQSGAIGVASSTTYAFAIDVNKLAAPGVLDHMRIAIIGVPGTPQVYYNINARTVGTQTGATGFYKEQFDRVVIVFNSGTATSVNVRINAASADNNASITTTEATDYADFWAAQLEPSPFATSYIPTVASAVSRAADRLTYTFGAINPPLTAEAQIAPLASQTSSGSVFEITDGSSGADRAFLGLSGGDNPYAFVNAESVNQLNQVFAGQTASIGSWQGLRFTANDAPEVEAYLGGLSAGAQPVAAFPDALDRIDVGTNLGGGQPFQFGFIGPIALFDQVVAP